MSDDPRKAYKTVVMGWLIITLTANFVIAIFVPFPYSLGCMVAVVVLTHIYVKRRVLKRLGIETRSPFNWGAKENRLVTYYCLHCGYKHDKDACPKCKSKAKRTGF